MFLRLARHIACFSILLLAACQTVAPPDPRTQLAGDYAGASGETRTFHSIVPLDLPRFGGDVFYHHISLESVGGPAMQRKIYRFSDNGAEMRAVVFPAGGETLGAREALVRELAGLDEATLLRFPEGCQLRWTQTADGFEATVRRQDCAYESRAFGGVVRPEMSLRLTPCSLTVAEGIYRETGEPVIPFTSIVNDRVSRTEDC